MNREGKFGGNLEEAFVARPKAGMKCEPGGGEQVRIHVPDAESEKRAIRYKLQDFTVMCRDGLRQILKGGQDQFALLERSHGELAEHEGMHQHLPAM